MRDPLMRADKIRAGFETERRMFRPYHEIAAHASRQIEDDAAALLPDPVDDFAKKRGISARRTGTWIPDVKMDDGGAGRLAMEGRGGDLRRCHGHIPILADRVGGAGHGAGDENLCSNHGGTMVLETRHAVQCAAGSRWVCSLPHRLAGENVIVSILGVLCGRKDMALHILLIQEDAAGAKIVRDALANSRDQEFSVEWVRTCAQALARLAGVDDLPPTKAGAVAAVLGDLRVPDVWGIDCFNLLFDAAPQVPILILSTLEDEAVAKLAVHRGAHDYLLQGLMDGYLLPKTLAGMIEGASNTEALFDEKERAQVTLNSIGDAVISTEASGHVTYLNIVAERLTGWARTGGGGR